MTQKIKNIYSIYLNVLIILIVYICYYIHINNLFRFDLKSVTILAVSLNIIIVVYYLYKYKNIKSVYFLFQTFSIPFFYGFLFVRYVLGIKFKNIYDLSSLVDVDTEIIAVFLIIFCQLFINLGYISFRQHDNSKKSNNDLTKDSSNIDNRIYLYIGIILIVISIVPAMENYYKNFISCMKLGYRGRSLTVTYGINSISTKIVPFFYIGLLN